MDHLGVDHRGRTDKSKLASRALRALLRSYKKGTSLERALKLYSYCFLYILFLLESSPKDLTTPFSQQTLVLTSRVICAFCLHCFAVVLAPARGYCLACLVAGRVDHHYLKSLTPVAKKHHTLLSNVARPIELIHIILPCNVIWQWLREAHVEK